jgi:hypothetical protein
MEKTASPLKDLGGDASFFADRKIHPPQPTEYIPLSIIGRGKSPAASELSSGQLHRRSAKFLLPFFLITRSKPAST